MSSDLPERRIPVITLMSQVPSSAQSRSMYGIAVDPINHQLFLGFKTDKEICARARRRVSPSHVMSAEALDRRYDEVEIALDFPRALFEILMVYATPQSIGNAFCYAPPSALESPLPRTATQLIDGTIRMLGLSGGLPVML